MKTLAMILVLFICLASCKDDPTTLPVDQPNEPVDAIQGLELKFIAINYLYNNLKAVYFVDETNGYVAGYNGVMYKTTDGGNTWEELNTNTTLTINDIYFFDTNEGFAVGGESFCSGNGCIPAGALIIHTNDGGKTWRKVAIYVSDKTSLNSVCFVSDSVGYAVGFGTILSTKDRGVSWKQTKINDLKGNMMDVEFISDKEGLISCISGQLIKTTDGGLSWSVSSPFNTLGGHTLSLIGENLIYSASRTSIEKSNDFGNTWSYLKSYPMDIYKIVFKSENIGYAFGSGNYSGGDFGHNYGAIYYTTDGGSTWTGSANIKEIWGIESACFPTENIGYAISQSKVVKIRKR